MLRITILAALTLGLIGTTLAHDYRAGETQVAFIAAKTKAQAHTAWRQPAMVMALGGDELKEWSIVDGGHRLRDMTAAAKAAGQPALQHD